MSIRISVGRTQKAYLNCLLEGSSGGESALCVVANGAAVVHGVYIATGDVSGGGESTLCVVADGAAVVYGVYIATGNVSGGGESTFCIVADGATVVYGVYIATGDVSGGGESTLCEVADGATVVYGVDITMANVYGVVGGAAIASVHRCSENLGESKESEEQVYSLECDVNHCVWFERARLRDEGEKGWWEGCHLVKLLLFISERG